MFSFLRNRILWHWAPRLRYVSLFPDHLDIEISSICNMKCPMCYTITDKFRESVKTEFMSLDLFKKIIDECAKYGAFSVRLSLRGEPFLHNDIIEMIAYAKKKGIKEVSTLTNNLALTPDIFEECLRVGLDWLTISFDGLHDTYEWIRQPASFPESYEKIKEYFYIKKRLNSVKPVIKVQTVWPAIKENPQEYIVAFQKYVDDIAINPLVDYLHADTDIQYDQDFECPVLYQRLVIGSDGNVMLCSNDEFCSYSLGDANTESLYSLWHGTKLTRAREIHKRRAGVNSLPPCKHCFLPRKTQPIRTTIGTKEILLEKYIDRADEVGK